MVVEEKKNLSFNKVVFESKPLKKLCGFLAVGHSLGVFFQASKKHQMERQISAVVITLIK